jgi:hypothetical protein
MPSGFALVGVFACLIHKYGYKVLCMKTTIELPDALLIAAKKKAAELRLPLRDLIEDGLRARMAERNSRPKRHRKIRWITVSGGVPPGLDIRDRVQMHDWLRAHP